MPSVRQRLHCRNIALPSASRFALPDSTAGKTQRGGGVTAWARRGKQSGQGAHAMNTIDTITLLNRLIVTAKDGEAALRAAADEAYHADIKEPLSEYSHFLGDAARELQAAVHNLGGKPKGAGTFGNTLHRTWIHIKANAYGRDEGVILNEIEADEQAAEARFSEALTWDTPPAIHALLERQYVGTHARHGQIQALRARLDAPH
jgi:uncharacterized protein (TIGR02284 family)